MEPTQNQTSETTPVPTAPVKQNLTEQNVTVMGVLCYLGPLIIIPYMTDRDNSFVKFHIKQGVILFGVEVIIYILGSIFLFSGLYQIIMLLNLGTFILAIMGIINVVGKKEVPLPLIGQFANKVKI